MLDEAIELYRKAIKGDPKDADFYNNLGAALRDKGDLDEAVTILRKAIELDPSFARPHHDLGLTFTRQKKINEAIEAYQRAVELNPKEVDAWSALAEAYEALGKDADADAEAAAARADELRRQDDSE